LEAAEITVNRNTVPFDTRKPFITSGLRIGTPALTTRGMKETEMDRIGEMIADTLSAKGEDQVTARVREEVRRLVEAFPLYEGL